MRRLSFKVEPSNLQQSESGAIFGTISLIVDDTHFPEAGWSDLVIAVLVEFRRAVDNLAAGSSAETVSFFDGPFEVTMLPRDGDTISLVAGRRGGPRDLIIAEVPQHDLAEAIAEAATVIHTECERRGWIGADIARLTR